MMQKLSTVVAAGVGAAAMLASTVAASEGAAGADQAPMLANAMEFIARASSTSEVLTLNLTNLLILLVLKALIFGFGLFSVGGAGRSTDGGDLTAGITQSDLTGGMCFLMYTSGAEEKLDCVLRTACEDPYLASDYLTAAKMWYKMHKLMNSVVPFDEKYSKIMYGVKEAAEHGKTGDECSAKYAW
jgi:hypothetical protein